MWSRWATSAVCLLVVAGCGVLQSTVVVENHAASELVDLRLTAARQEIWTGRLAPGASHTVTFRPAMDGSLELVGMLNGKPLDGEPMGYTTHGDSSRHRLRVERDGRVVYSVER